MLSELRINLEFLLTDWLKIDELLQRPHFADHSWESITDLLRAAERIAADKFEPYNRLIDTEVPRLDGERVILPKATHDAWDSLVEFGVIPASQDYENGGMQLPRIAEFAVNTLFAASAVAMCPDALTESNASLLVAYGTDMQKKIFATNEFEGRWTGTMALSEPQAGSSLADITTKALPDGGDFERDPFGPRYRLTGNKMWISAAEHELTENIIHLVLAKTPNPDGTTDPSTRGISLFIVPKVLVDLDGKLTEHNDVALIGLNHKIGFHGIPNTSLSFGDGSYQPLGKSGAVGYLVGQAGQGLRQMFHMMNTSRIRVGLGAAALGYAGYAASLDYARTRTQGRPMTLEGKDASKPQVPIIEHADVKRMLLVQKAYSEGSIALCLYCARLLDEQKTGGADEVRNASVLLDTLTPIVKSWPSEWCLEANNLAIQVLGGVGYTPDFPVEQFWRDNRLNMIHEGTHGIQALDLLGRKVVMHDGEGLTLLEEEIAGTIERARERSELANYCDQLNVAVQKVREATAGAWSTGNREEALANATPYMQGFGHVVLAWIWLDIVAAIMPTNSPIAEGKRAAMRYFFAYELPKIDAWLGVARDRVPVCTEMQDSWF
jgi:alkylation response protein AidB-like acyl-CoA dehydrogenase